MTDTAATETPETVACGLCGFPIADLDLSEESSRGPIHLDRQCPKGIEKKVSKRPARKPAAVTAEAAAKPATPAVKGAHADCEHASTKAARAACRRQRAKDAE